MNTVVTKDGLGNDKYFEVEGVGTLVNPFKTKTEVSIGNNANTDAFGRLRVSNPTAIFDAQLTYDLQPTIIESITDLTGATILHDTTNRCALLGFANTPVGGKSFLQTYEYFRYQPGKSQLAFITFNFVESVVGATKFAGYSDGVNGFEFQNTGSVNQFVIYSESDNGDQIAVQSEWNLDKLDGTGRSGITLDITKTHILVLDFQALYVGRVRFGFDINGVVVYVHEFNHANIAAVPYVQTANLPVRCGMISTATVSTTMKYICCNVTSEGGQELTASYDFARWANVSAANGVDTHLLSIRPKLLFNNITNRTKFGFIEVEIMVTGANPIQWKLAIGQPITGALYGDINTLYSAAEYTTAGALNGTAAIIINSGFIPATSQNKGSSGSKIVSRFPLTLNAAGLQRLLGTLTLLVSGIGGTSTTYGCIKWREVR